MDALKSVPGKASNEKLKDCICIGGQALQGLHKELGNHSVVAYLRAESEQKIAEQRRLIQEFCHAQGYRIASELVDIGSGPALSWHQTIAALKNCDALIVANLERLVQHHRSRARELRPLLHKFVCEGGKHLIAIQEGINTATTSGQKVAVEFINQLKDADEN